MAPDELASVAAFAIESAHRAGERTLEHFHTSEQVGVTVETKDDGTPVTRADREAERLLREAIAARYPDDAIVGEEEGGAPAEGGRTWILDPIDGTKSFVHGVPLYAILVALAVPGGAVDGRPRPVVGVVHLPALGETVAAWRGGGCWWNGRRVEVSATSRVADALVLGSDFPGLETDDVAVPLFRAARLRRTWGDAYGYALVATGRADVMIDPIVSPWDVAAVQPLIEEAGGVFSDLDGAPTPWSGHAVASNGQIHDEVLALLER
ncbi:MAG: inositol monophosphatase family protein [Acidobacteriota bacterium]